MSLHKLPIAHSHSHDHERAYENAYTNTDENSDTNWDEWEAHIHSESTAESSAETDHQHVIVEWRDKEVGQDQDPYIDNRRRGYYQPHPKLWPPSMWYFAVFAILPTFALLIMVMVNSLILLGKVVYDEKGWWQR